MTSPGGHRAQPGRPARSRWKRWDARRSRRPNAVTSRGKIEPGEYTVVLEHYVTEDILTMLNFYGMGAQAVLEGRSWMNDRIGQPIMSPQVSIWDDGLDSQGIAAAL